MKANSIVVWFAFATMSGAYGQTLDFTFTANDNAVYVKLDSIKVMNRSRGDETVIHWPDTTLTLTITPGDTLLYIGYSAKYPVGVREIRPNTGSFQLFQNYPNPVNDRCLIALYIPESGTVDMAITDMQGRVIIHSDRKVEKGTHNFRFTPGSAGLYLLTASYQDERRSIKILSRNPDFYKKCLLEYSGNSSKEHSLKAETRLQVPGVLESGILDAPGSNRTCTFQFATNISCPGIPVVEYEGQIYHTIQIFSQCWLKENLNVGIMIDGSQDQTDNGIKEKHCYDDDPANCSIYGGLYAWDEMMQYSSQQGIQGICPPGWHLPADEEWKVVEGATDSLFGIGDPEWDIFSSSRGYDVGKNLKATNHWAGNGNGVDLYGFSGLPGGYRGGMNYFDYLTDDGWWWSSTAISDILAWDRTLDSGPEVFRAQDYQGIGISVRCLRNQ